MVGLTGGSSKETPLLRRLAAELPAQLRHRAPRSKPVKPRQVQRRPTPDQLDHLVRQYEVGDDMKVLAAGWSVYRATVAAQLQRAGVTLRRTGLPGDRLDEAVRLYGEGSSCQRLAERYACDNETVRQAPKREGIKLRAPWERA